MYLYAVYVSVRDIASVELPVTFALASENVDLSPHFYPWWKIKMVVVREESLSGISFTTSMMCVL